MDWQVIQGAGEVTAAVAAVVAIWASFRLHAQQAKITNQLHGEQIALSKKVHEEEKLLSQRQLLLPLMQTISQVRDIDTAKPHWPDVVALMNSLEILALCYESEAVDPAVIRRTYSEKFIELYDKIGECKNPPEGWRSGRQLLAENKAAGKLRDELKQFVQNQNALQPIAR